MRYEVAGARGHVEDPEGVLERARSLAAARGAEVLLADARAVLGRDHLESAVRHALRAQEDGRMVARTVSLESLRYLAGQRQVSDAIRTAGLRRGTSQLAVVSFGDLRPDEVCEAFRWKRDDGVLDPEGKSLRVVGIDGRAETTVPRGRAHDLALERVALLDVTK